MEGAANSEAFCRQLKSNQHTREIPVLLMSSNVNIKAVAVACGAEGNLSKSASLSVIKNKIENLMRIPGGIG
jgi:DNA-binding NarL/FixJ family response regulator